MKEYFTKFINSNLHVCSRNIRVGDIVQTPRGEGNCVRRLPSPRWKTHDIVTIKFKECTYDIDGEDCDCTEAYALNEFEAYKIIGIIPTPEQWITEYMELDKDDLLANGVGVNWDDIPTDIWKFKVKCPTCKNYH